MRYDIIAKTAPGTAREQGLQMMQVLLAERFRLTLHREQRVLAYYALVVAKGGPRMGKRDKVTTDIFIEGLRDAILPGCKFQITSDGFAPYKNSIPDTFGDRVDFAMLIKVYRAAPDGERNYSLAEVQSVEVVPVYRNPDPERICTSIIERSNLSLRMGQRRWTRLTNAFSKKWENHAAAMMLWYAYYNFCRVHRSLRVTPAMEAGITDRIWQLSDLLG